jgi:hypothetical protein
MAFCVVEHSRWNIATWNAGHWAFRRIHGSCKSLNGLQDSNISLSTTWIIDTRVNMRAFTYEVAGTRDPTPCIHYFVRFFYIRAWLLPSLRIPVPSSTTSVCNWILWSLTTIEVGFLLLKISDVPPATLPSRLSFQSTNKHPFLIVESHRKDLPGSNSAAII